MEKIIKAGLVGVTGYTGMELVRVILGHPLIELVAATSRAEAGKTLAELMPHVLGTSVADLVVTEPDAQALAKSCDIVFLAVPHGAAMEIAAALLSAGTRVIDLSADFRLRDPTVYEEWYNKKHAFPGLLFQAVYGLPEIYGELTAKANLVANPGCYPTSVILGLYPLLRKDCVKPEGVIVDSKSGATGAGRKPGVPTLYCEVQDSFRAYNVGGKHRHTPEMEQELTSASGKEMTISFNPHLLPINRGILSTIYAQLSKKLSIAEIRDIYVKAYADCPMVRVLPAGKLPETRNVRGTMFCDIGLVMDERVNRLIVLTAIDNLCRGASGQAVANANLMFGLPVATGLNMAPLVP